MNPKSQVIGCFHNVVVNEERIDVGAGAGVAVVDVLSQLHVDKHWQMLQSDDPKDVGGSTDLGQLLPWNFDLAPVHKLDYVGHGLSIQLQPSLSLRMMGPWTFCLQSWSLKNLQQAAMTTLWTLMW